MKKFHFFFSICFPFRLRSKPTFKIEPTPPPCNQIWHTLTPNWKEQLRRKCVSWYKRAGHELREPPWWYMHFICLALPSSSDTRWPRLRLPLLAGPTGSRSLVWIVFSLPLCGGVFVRASSFLDFVGLSFNSLARVSTLFINVLVATFCCSSLSYLFLSWLWFDVEETTNARIVIKGIVASAYGSPLFETFCYTSAFWLDSRDSPHFYFFSRDGATHSLVRLWKPSWISHKHTIQFSVSDYGRLTYV